MNFYDLFEASKENKDTAQDVTISDPKAALALKQARAKYSYADNDLEAFIKMVQDQDEEESSEIDQLEADTARQENLIKQNIEQLEKNQQTIARLRNTEKQAMSTIEQLSKENQAQNHALSVLRGKEREYEEWAASLINDINSMTQKFSGIQLPSGGTFKAEPLAKPSIDKLSK